MKLSAEAKVGLLVFAGIMLLTYMSFQVGEFHMGRREGTTFDIVFDSAAGLSKDASVQIAGVEVGKVQRIFLQDGKAHVTVRLERDTPIPDDSSAVIRSVGLLGDKHVDVQLGQSGRTLEAGETIASPPTGEDINQLVGQLSSIAEDMKAVSSSLKGALGGEEGEKSLREIVGNFRDLSSSLTRVVTKNEERFDRILGQIDEMSTNLNETVRQNQAAFRRTLSNAQGASASLKNIFNKVDQGEGTLGRLVNEDALSENLNEALESANDVLGVKKKYETFVSLRNESLVEPDDSKGYVSLKLQPRKDKFYLFELVSPEKTKGDFSEETTVNEIVNTGPGAGSDFFPTSVTQTIHKRKTSDDLMFTAMFGRTFGQTSYRIGLQENTGGIGIDHMLLGNRLGLHFDIWDFEGENSFGGGAHAKFRTDFNFLKYFYINAGFDNFLNNEDSSLFYGAGIAFKDDDIKDLFSLLPLK
ncbi:MAG: MlaD family protein [bacterium]|nr:MlaD family protein [bacterium]